jgi:succinate dehydrogenase / fumarate reductase cytochrome b subunit
MSAQLVATLNTSVAKKQIIAVTGFLQAFFVLGHLAGNFFLFVGPEAFNGYAQFLAERGSFLLFVRTFLIVCFLIHIFFGVRIYLENRKARGQRYAVSNSLGKTNLAKRTMVLSGMLVFFFLWIHLADFTLKVKEGQSLFNLVWSSFLFTEVWWRPLVYLCVVCLLGLHVGHGMQSVFQTFGLEHDRITPWIRRVSTAFGLFVAVGYSSIPLYVNIVKTPPV